MNTPKINQTELIVLGLLSQSVFKLHVKMNKNTHTHTHLQLHIFKLLCAEGMHPCDNITDSITH